MFGSHSNTSLLSQLAANTYLPYAIYTAFAGYAIYLAVKWVHFLVGRSAHETCSGDMLTAGTNVVVTSSVYLSTALLGESVLVHVPTPA